MYLVSPSILSADFAHLADDLALTKAAGADVFVAGSYFFGAKDRAAATAALKA